MESGRRRLDDRDALERARRTPWTSGTTSAGWTVLPSSMRSHWTHRFGGRTSSNSTSTPSTGQHKFAWCRVWPVPATQGIPFLGLSQGPLPSSKETTPSLLRTPLNPPPSGGGWVRLKGCSGCCRGDRRVQQGVEQGKRRSGWRLANRQPSFSRVDGLEKYRNEFLTSTTDIDDRHFLKQQKRQPTGQYHCFYT